jgi:hypothetical protein
MEAHGIHDLSETINALATAYEFIPATPLDSKFQSEW